jgi:hypothetical protein
MKLRDVSRLEGFNELQQIIKYAMGALEKEEKQFIEKINQTVQDFRTGKNERPINFKESTQIKTIWQKYRHLKPFQFTFDLSQKIPQVFKNLTAFIIWTTWSSNHPAYQKDDIEIGSLAAAKLLSEGAPPFSKELKKRAVIEFLKFIYPVFATEEREFDFWELNIFPFLEKKWEFKLETINKN